MTMKLNLTDLGCGLRGIRIDSGNKGPKVLITAGIHGGEYVGILTARAVAADLMAGRVAGSVTIIPCVNENAFHARVPAVNPADGLNINRMFPGDANGSSSQRIAARLTELQGEADFYIDMHGGDIHEKLTPYLYIPGNCKPEVTEVARAAAKCVDVPVRVLSQASTGAYNSAALRGTPSMLIELGCGGRWSREELEYYRTCITSVLKHLGVIEGEAPQMPGQRECAALYIEVPCHGLWFPLVDTGDAVAAGQLLGTIESMDGTHLADIKAEAAGTVLYMTRTLSVVAGADLLCYG